MQAAQRECAAPGGPCRKCTSPLSFIGIVCAPARAAYAAAGRAAQRKTAKQSSAGKIGVHAAAGTCAHEHKSTAGAAHDPPGLASPLHLCKSLQIASIPSQWQGVQAQASVG
ncbi:hypothetical protein BX661DRAFT_198405 [Kickxella alabastrina]|uniref:uncharacterized protein n=1 Tax=Kickxella alabastrina TaxID=61397 RepID=UPI00221FC39F|nr:uncharacterized protein BX661DRAFT_198405 [Kickxella alabastrina]KAI7827830.1 hypothetical protein BX661DRAFT_198405 [Kickxella alabastrina]